MSDELAKDSPAGPAWPIKTRELHNHHLDSTVWNDFAFRDDDIVIATYAKSGTTWTQQIVAQLLFAGDTDVETHEISPWVDFRLPPKEGKLAALEAQQHRRFIKTHLPVDALVYSPKAKYIYVGRDGRDVLWSLYNHYRNGAPAMYAALNDYPGRVGPPFEPPPDDIKQFWSEWLERDGYPLWSFWENVRSWWEIRDLPNILLVHFENLKQDLPKEIRRIAAFLEIEIDESKWDEIVEHCTFEWMKENGEKAVPMRGVMWIGGAQTFIHKGTNGRWKERLKSEDCAQYETRARAELGSRCAHWLATGEISGLS